MKLELIVRSQFWDLDQADLLDIASEARTIQFERYGTLLDEQAKCHCRLLIMEAARNLGYLPLTVNIAGQGSDKVQIASCSFEQLAENGFDPAADDAPERPEAVIARILSYLPDGPIRQVFVALLDEEVFSIEAAAKAHDLTPQRIFDVLRKIGSLLLSYDESNDGLFVNRCSDKGLRSAIARVCDSLTRRDPATAGFCWEQEGLF